MSDSEISKSFEKISEILLAILFLGLLLGALAYIFMPIFLAPFILPLSGKCLSGEGLYNCYYRIQIEKEKLNRFEDCQRSCGLGIGSSLCLEKCEYNYGFGKWSNLSINKYTTSKGVNFTCWEGSQGYEDSSGRYYCQ